MAENECMAKSEQMHTLGRFDIYEIARSFPESAATLLLDRYLIDQPEASVRVFRVYRATPAHYHAASDEHLYVVSGRGTFWMESDLDRKQFAPGQLLFFKRGTVHALPEILEAPVVFLAIDTPRRNPQDVIFVCPEDGTPASFIQPQE